MTDTDAFSNIESGDGVREPLPKPSSSPKQVLKRVFFTRTEMAIYPNGQTYPGKTSSWFSDHVYAHKPKVKKKLGEYKKEKGVVEL